MRNFDKFSWAVGFYEGEGCISYETGKTSVCLQISQKDRAPLDFFQECVGTEYRLTGPYEQANCYRLQISGIKAWTLALEMYPYLSKRRQGQILEKMNTVYNSRYKDGRGYVPPWMILPDKELV